MLDVCQYKEARRFWGQGMKHYSEYGGYGIDCLLGRSSVPSNMFVRLRYTTKYGDWSKRDGVCRICRPEGKWYLLVLLYNIPCRDIYVLCTFLFFDISLIKLGVLTNTIVPLYLSLLLLVVIGHVK